MPNLVTQRHFWVLKLEHEADVATDWDAEGEKEVQGGPDWEENCKQYLYKGLFTRKYLGCELAYGEQNYESDGYDVAQAVADTFRALRFDDLEAFEDI